VTSADGPKGLAERLLAAYDGEVLSECADLLADASPAAPTSTRS
jgi:hypothetical protein